MAGPLFEPNLHAMLVHYPLALVTLGVVIEFLSVLFWRKSSIRTAGRWMVVIGILMAVPTVTTGMYALRDTVDTGGTSEIWANITAASPWSDDHWHALKDHLSYTVSGVLLLLAGIVVWIAGTDAARKNMYLLGLVVLIVSAGLIGYGAHYGGQLVYRHGTAVLVTSPDVAAAPRSAEPSVDEGLEAPAVEEALPGIPEGVSALEMHLFFAGCAIALIAAAIGLSVRLSNVAWENRFAEEKAVAAGYRPAGKMGQDSNLLAIAIIYPGTLWIIAVLLSLAAAALGLWLFGVSSVGDLVSKVRSNQGNDHWRPVLHVYYGLSIIALSILTGIVMRLWPRRRLLMGILCTLLVLAVIGQAWTGTIMLFDGTKGPVMRFNRMAANRPVSVKTLPPATMPADVLRPPSSAHTQQLPEPPKPAVDPRLFD